MAPPTGSSLPIAGLSYVRGSAEPALCEDTVFDLLASAAQRWPEHEGAVFLESGVRLTWAELLRQSEQAATGLARLGVRAGDRVGIWSPNRPEWLVTQFAAARLGAILVTLNPAYQQAEVAHALNQAGVAVLVTVAAFGSSNCVGMLGNLGFGVDEGGGRLPHLMAVVCLGDDDTPGMPNWNTLMRWGQERDAALAPASGLRSREPAAILYTSGTTGAPKGATLTHHNIVNNACAVARGIRLDERDAVCIPVPLYHCFGLVLSALACTARGATMVFPSDAFDAVATLEAVQSECCTALHGVPAMFLAELRQLEVQRVDLGSLRTGIMAGACCPADLVRRVRRDMHLGELTIAYGMTETGPVSFQSRVDERPEHHPHAVGRVLPHLEAKVIDADGRIVPVGEHGELCTRGYSVMQGYWHDADRTAEAVRDGWMHTGDLATLDAQGLCRIVGRVSEMVLRGSESVHPLEVEERLVSHPKIAAAEVFGVPDEVLGEELCAWVITKPGVACTTAEIRAYCDRQLPPSKVPRHIRFVDKLPVTVTGKPRKFVMRDLMMRELGLDLVPDD